MDKKQTAVDWLVEQVFGKHTYVWKDVINHAKQMEKEQLIDAYTEGYDIRDNMGSLLTNPTGEQYYNTTYNSKK